MYSEHREPKCRVCGEKRPTCGDPAIYCRECAIALQTGKSDSFHHGRRPAHNGEANYHGRGADWG